MGPLPCSPNRSSESCDLSPRRAITDADADAGRDRRRVSLRLADRSAPEPQPTPDNEGPSTPRLRFPAWHTSHCVPRYRFEANDQRGARGGRRRGRRSEERRNVSLLDESAPLASKHLRHHRRDTNGRHERIADFPYMLKAARFARRGRLRAAAKRPSSPATSAGGNSAQGSRNAASTSSAAAGRSAAAYVATPASLSTRSLRSGPGLRPLTAGSGSADALVKRAAPGAAGVPAVPPRRPTARDSFAVTPSPRCDSSVTLGPANHGREQRILAIRDLASDGGLRDAARPGEDRRRASDQWAGWESNPRSTDYESAALTAELPARPRRSLVTSHGLVAIEVVVLSGLCWKICLQTS